MYIYIHIYTYVYIYIYTYMYVLCMYMEKTRDAKVLPLTGSCFCRGKPNELVDELLRKAQAEELQWPCLWIYIEWYSPVI